MALYLNDKTSNGNNLTNNNGVTEVTTSLPFAASASAAGFAVASSQYLSIADASQTGLDLSGDFTIEAWIKLTSVPSAANTYEIVSKNDTSTANRGYTFRLIGQGSGEVWVRGLIAQDASGTTLDYGYWSWFPTAGVWYHLALTCTIANPSATTFELFIDGSSQGNGTMTNTSNCTSIYNNAAQFCIGALSNPANYFDGSIDDVRVWNDVRTPTEISNNMSVELTGSEANLVGYWPFEAIVASSPSASLSPSASASPSASLSPSASVSSSASLSPSASASRSPSPSLAENTLSIDLYEVCFPLVYSSKYSAQSNIYTAKYSTQSTAYADKYSKVCIGDN